MTAASAHWTSRLHFTAIVEVYIEDCFLLKRLILFRASLWIPVQWSLCVKIRVSISPSAVLGSWLNRKESIIIHSGCIYAARVSHVDLPLGSPGFLWTSYSCLINIAAEAPVGHCKGNCRQEAALPSISPSLSLSLPVSGSLPLSPPHSSCLPPTPPAPPCILWYPPASSCLSSLCFLWSTDVSPLPEPHLSEEHKKRAVTLKVE